MVWAALAMGFGCGLFAPPATVAADSNIPIPLVIQNGFKSLAAKDASDAFDVWKKGGLMEDDGKPGKLAGFFNRMDRTIGGYKSYEIIESKRINQTSQIIYLSINFERAAVYARFLVYRTDKDWVVQNMDFSPKPEAIMPWLAFAGGDYTQ